MPTTSNFGWTTPADTDLVKDGAAAIRTLGNGIDTSLVDLKGGTTGQNLRKASDTDLDFTFAGDATNTVVDAAGDLLYGTAADTLGRLAIGTAGQVLKVNSGATAPEWSAAGSSFAGCRLTKSASQTITFNTITALTWDVETFDSDAYHSTVTNTSRITIPSGKAGKYLIETVVAWLDNGSTGMKYINLRKNNTVFAWWEQTGQATTGQQPQLLTSTVDCAVNDYIEVFVYTAAAGNSTVQGDPYNAGASHFSASFLGA